MKKRLRSANSSSAQDPRLRAMKAFGGTLFKKAKYRKSRPLSTKSLIHIVLRSTKAKGSRSFQNPKNWKPLEKLCFDFATRYGVQIRQYKNGGNHLHLAIRLKNRLQYARFIRALTGAIAQKVTGANKLKALKESFWDFRPFTYLEKEDTPKTAQNDYVTLLETLKIIPRLAAPARASPK